VPIYPDAMPLIDLTHTFCQDMPVFPGDPPAKLEQTAHLGRDEYNMYSLCGGLHVGTHIDAPLHMIAGGSFVCDLPAEKFFGCGRLIDARGRDAVTPDLLQDAKLRAGDIVLVLTGWYHRFRDATYYTDYPELTPDFARQLIRTGPAAVGLDTPSPDRSPFEVHKILLSTDHREPDQPGGTSWDRSIRRRRLAHQVARRCRAGAGDRHGMNARRTAKRSQPRFVSRMIRRASRTSHGKVVGRSNRAS
jgi:kynurenine formamidase